MAAEHAIGGGGRGGGGPRGPPRRREYNPSIPIIVEDLVTIEEKVFFPIDQYPGFNFVGRLLGPKGANLKEFVQTTKTKVSILGKGSSKDRSKEAELLKSDDPEHAHLKEPVHVIISAKGPKVSAHRKMAAALRALNRFMVPGDDRERQPEVLDEQPAYIDERDERRPIVRIGAPPPGAIILAEEPLRGEGRARREPPPHDSYPPEDRYYDAPRRGEPRDSQRYDYPEDRRPPRGGPANGYSPSAKRYKEDPYAREPYGR